MPEGRSGAGGQRASCMRSLDCRRREAVSSQSICHMRNGPADQRAAPLATAAGQRTATARGELLWV
eukprot:7602800-Pyramimonas_sp.AAC.1